MDLLIGFINFICIMWTVISISGYVTYRCQAVDSWESGIKKFITAGFTFLYKELSGNVLPDEIINTALICTNDEALELVRRLVAHPYDTPTLVSYEPNINGIVWYDISAVGLIPSYPDLSNQGITEIVSHIIQNFFIETRGTQVLVDIKVATSTRLYFAIPLSEMGRKFLAQQRAENIPNVTTKSTPDILEEEIDIWTEGGQDNDCGVSPK